MSEIEIKQRWVKILTEKADFLNSVAELAVNTLWEYCPVVPAVCPQCGKDDIDTERYCNNCGQRWYD